MHADFFAIANTFVGGVRRKGLKALKHLNDLNVCANTRPANTFVDVGAF
ncbi:MAG: hypothetical protein LBD59_08585 [Prevotellaceae bacterium]|nr:hypothetical protein [Prevotellaceae bacterium]